MARSDSSYSHGKQTQESSGSARAWNSTQKSSSNTPRQAASEEALERSADQAAARALSNSVGRTRATDDVRISTDSGLPVGSAPQSIHEVVQGSGESMPAAVRSDMEQRFGHDFSRVRVHADADAVRSAEDIHAEAYTAGDHIAFGAGRYAPETSDGRQLLAHELAHVVQQRGGNYSNESARTVQRRGESEKEDESESKAASVARAAERSRRNSGDRTRMMINASEIVYRLIDLFMPDYKDRISSVGYEESLKQVRVDVSGSSLQITVGKAFVLGTSRATLENSALAIGSAILAKAPRKGGHRKGLLGSMMEEQQRAPGAKLTFEEALMEGANVLHAAGFGLVCGTGPGPDTYDKYDSRDWREKESRREVLVPKIEPWLAFSRLVNNLGKDVPAPDGRQVKWGFDCFGFVIINRVYAHWRTLTRGEFNAKYATLELGINSNINREWEKPILTDRPGAKPYVAGEVKEGRTPGVFEQEKTVIKQGWNDLLESAPVGTQVTWGNQDAKDKCTANSTLSFCAYMFENTTKVGRNKYSAHPFGVVSREYIEDAMASAVLEAEGRPTTESTKKAYIRKYVFITGMRVPRKSSQEGSST